MNWSQTITFTKVIIFIDSEKFIDFGCFCVLVLFFAWVDLADVCVLVFYVTYYWTEPFLSWDTLVKEIFLSQRSYFPWLNKG